MPLSACGSARSYPEGAKRSKKSRHVRLLRRVPKFKNSKWLVTQYSKKGRSFSAIAVELGMSKSTVGRQARKFGIKVRRPAGREKLKDRKWLRQKYVLQGLTMRQIGLMLGYSPTSEIVQ